MRRRLSTVPAAFAPVFAALAAMMMAPSVPVAAQGWIEPLPGRVDGGVVKLRTNVTVRVTDRVAQVEVEEWFENRGGLGPGEGDYLYPLPGEAVFGGFSLVQGDAELSGEMLEAERGRAIAGRLFREEGGAWVDALHRPEARVVEIESFGEAYFALLRRLPELEPYWAQMPDVLVAGRELSIRVTAEGASRLSDAELTRIVRAFRFETS